MSREIQRGATICSHGVEPYDCRVCFPIPTGTPIERLLKAVDVMLDKRVSVGLPCQTLWSEYEELARAASIVRDTQETWMDVKDNLPEACGEYLCAATYFKDETVGQEVMSMEWSGETWYLVGHRAIAFGITVTHWRKFPAPPDKI